MSGSSRQLTLKKGAPGDQVWDLLCMQLASYLEGGRLMWMIPLHLHVNQKSDYDDNEGASINFQMSFPPICKSVYNKITKEDFMKIFTGKLCF